MAIMKSIIYIEGFGTGNNRFAVYSDLTLWQIQNIGGVHDVSEVNEGYLLVTIDKRFDIREVLDEIKSLADKEKADKEK